MFRVVRIASAIALGISQLLFIPLAYGEAPAGVVISQLVTGDSVSASNEIAELYNNTAADVDITNWCVRYATAAGNVQSTPRYCFTPADAQTRIFLAAHGYALLVTPSFTLPDGMSPDGRFTGSGMAAGGGHVSVVDEHGATIDTVGWGSAANAEGGEAAPAPTVVQSLLRTETAPDVLQDTNNNKADFVLVTPVLRGGGVYEERTAIDLCGNLEGIQEVLPAGYGYDEAGNCELLTDDLCHNIDAIQLEIPEGMVRNDDGACVAAPVDVCLNIEGLQIVAPLGYAADNGVCTRLEDRAVQLSEIFPNPKGTDAGQEFIELYNPYDEPILLGGYTLSIGKSFEKSYPLSLVADRTVIPAHGFVTFSDSELGFTLLNTLSGVRLVAPAGNTVSETVYMDPKDDQSWAYIDGMWQYTSLVTPGTSNLLPDEGEVASANTLAPCPAGKYRNPLTNRCRNIEADAAILADCQEGYYRNPDTNRCRKIAVAASLTPCQAGYSRNPETNRCRKDTTESGLTPCKEGQERNPATNRCRKVTASNPTLNPASVAETADSHTSALPWVVGVIALGAVGYGVYEWRHEIGKGAGKFIARFKK